MQNRFAKWCVYLSLLLAPVASGASAAAPITPEQAAAHIGEMATVCGTVVDAKFANNVKGQPTFLNFGRAHPNEIFTVLIWGINRAKFASPESRLVGKRVCVTGLIQLYRGKPEIIATDPQQLVDQSPKV